MIQKVWNPSRDSLTSFSLQNPSSLIDTMLCFIPSRFNWHHALSILSFFIPSQDEIANHALLYFSDLYASDNASTPNSLIASVIPALVSEEDNIMLSSLPSSDEIKVLQQGWILPNLNSNSVVLIPKFPGALRIEDFRPIALANFQLKIITKVMVDRLALIAPKVISIQQRGFIRDRDIHDCICIASEAINLLDYKSFGGSIAIKLDIRKAFDTVDWCFLLDTLRSFGFNDKFGNWVKIILHNTRLSINVNGHSVGFFQCKRGVRQGDPLSPCSSALLRRGLKRSLLALTNLTHVYAQAFGQVVNLNKCKFYTGHVSPRKIANLADILGFSAGSLPFNYLGVPIFKGKPKKIHLQAIADRIIIKLSSWKGDIAVRKVVTISWQVVCSSYKSSGLGLKSLKTLNQAALLKLAREMASSDQEWAIFYMQRFKARNKANSYVKSSIWPGIRKNWPTVLNNSVWIVGNGMNINYWCDKWLSIPLIDSLSIPSSLHNSLMASVADFTFHSKWIIPKPIAEKFPNIAREIASIGISLNHNVLAWEGSNDGQLSLKDAFSYLALPSNPRNWCRMIWSDSISPSKSFTTWRLLHRRMPTNDQLQTRGCNLASMCSLCSPIIDYLLS
ncbi:PREDICTED: uncharacterized protein LOC109338368 [Lupinus angustifolius]|uniref:uncharacterized protein LOC109338368 n=1 Tax=Lupinus angustifolius TaxID=3871 RepID=UPI00092E3841|nr:PREDICTED: uncharacterized protein LOC109338368 [Lupinus angustifolius]